MGDIINLNKARKTRTRLSAERQGAANRAKHGRTKAARLAEEAESARRETGLDRARRSGGDDDDSAAS